MQIANPLLQKMNMVENLSLRLVISPQALGGAVPAAASSSGFLGKPFCL